MTFYENTYTEKRVSESYGDESTVYSYGFYRLEGKTVYLQLQGTDNLANRTEYKRKNVFCLVSNGVKYRCKKAIGLQVFYSIMKVSTASIVLTQIIKEKKQKR